MKLIIFTALIAVCHTAKLDRTYLPPASAATAGGNHNSLQTPLIKTTDQVAPQSGTPLGSYTNEYQGVVVDAAAPGTRASSENNLSGLGAPRPSYGSTDSKVGEAAFRDSIYRGQGNAGASDFKPERQQASKDRNSNIITYSNDVNSDAYSYGFETDNGIAVGENGIAANGIQAEGGYSYQGDDGQTYKVTYVADDKGYRPQGAHLPTPPPIPDEILKSLQQNAQDEAAGVVDDGSYDAQKYNSEYTHNGAQLSQRPESDTSASGSFINQNNQAMGTDRFGSQNNQGHLNQGNQFGPNTQHHGFHGFSGSQSSQAQGESTGQNNGQFVHQTSQFGLTNNLNGHSSQFGTQSQSTQPSGLGIQAQLSQPSGSSESQYGSHKQSIQSSASHFGTQTQPTRPFGSQSTQSFGSQFGTQTQPSQPSGPSGPQFESHLQSTQTSGSQFGTQALPTQPSGSQFESHKQSNQPSGSQFGAQAQFTQGSGSQFRPQTQYTQSSGSSGSQFGIQAQSSHPSGSPFGVQAQSSQQSGSQYGANAQSTHPFRPQFGNLPQFGLQSNIQTKPQIEGLKPTDAAVSSSFSQSSVTPSPVSGNQFIGQNGNKPFNADSSQFSTQNQLNKFGASSTSRFPQAPNRFGANNDYLPPSNNIGSRPQYGAMNTFNNGQNQNRPSQNFNSQTQSQEFQYNSAFDLPSKANNLQSQRPNQFSGNIQSSQYQQNSQSSQTIPNLKPTSTPNTELTTPLEPNEVSTSSQSESSSQTLTNLGSSAPSFVTSAPGLGGSTTGFGGSTSSFGNSVSSNYGSSTPNLGGSKPTSGSSTSSFGVLNKQPSNQFGQAQQFNNQGNLGINSQTAPTLQPQISSFQNGGLFNKPSNNGKPQFQQNYFSQNQKLDDSYYYNQPSKPFNTPQDSRFPNSPSYQSTVGQNSQFSQQNSFPKVPGSPVLSTSVNQYSQNQGPSTNFNGITQAAISPFPPISPTSSTQFGTTQNNLLGSKPTFSQSQSSTNKPSTSLPSKPQFGQKPTTSQSLATQDGFSNSQGNSQNEPIVQNLQYEGSVYEYNKPAETLPSAQSDSDSSQSIQSNILSSKPKENKPIINQISSKPTQVSVFGQNSFTQSQQPNSNVDISRPQFGLQSNNIPNRFSQTTQLGSQITSQQQSGQTIAPFATESSQTNFGQGPIGLAQQSLATTGSDYLGYPSAQDSKPQFGSNFGEISQFPTVSHLQSQFNTQGQKPNQPNLAFDSKPKPQNQFNQDSQSAQTATAVQQNFPTQFNQQSNLGSDSQPFPDMAIPSIVPSPPSKQFVPQTSAQAAVSSEPLDFLPLSKPQNQFNQPSNQQPVKSNQPSQFGSQYSNFQGSTAQSVSGKGEEFSGPRKPPSFDEKTGYHY